MTPPVTFASVNDMRTALEFVFAGIAVVGAAMTLFAVLFAVNLIRSLAKKQTTQTFEELLHNDRIAREQELKRWHDGLVHAAVKRSVQLAPSPYDLTKVGGLKRRA